MAGHSLGVGTWEAARSVTIFDSPVRSTEPPTVEHFPLALFPFSAPLVDRKAKFGVGTGKRMGMFSVFTTTRLKTMKTEIYQ